MKTTYSPIINEKARFCWIVKPKNQLHQLIEKSHQNKALLNFWSDFKKNLKGVDKEFEADTNIEFHLRLANEINQKIERLQAQEESGHKFYYHLIHNVN
jgi:hypothetical protein